MKENPKVTFKATFCFYIFLRSFIRIVVNAGL